MINVNFGAGAGHTLDIRQIRDYCKKCMLEALYTDNYLCGWKVLDAVWNWWIILWNLSNLDFCKQLNAKCSALCTFYNYKY